MRKRTLKSLKRRKQRERHQEISPSSPDFDVANQPLSINVQENEQILRSIFKDCSDIVFRPIRCDGETKLLIVYIDGVTDTRILDEAVIKPILLQGAKCTGNPRSLEHVIRDELIPVGQTKIVSTIQELVEDIVNCTVAILLEGEDIALIAEMQAFASRPVEEPANELSIRGPREGFTENLRVNTSLIRKRLRNPELKMESVTLGTETKTGVVIAYIRGIANDDLLREIRTRIERIEVDGILDSGNVEELIQDEPYSPFPQIENTERPDTVTAGLLQGRIAILVDGTPFVLIAPMTFWMALVAADDYYERFLYTSSIRIIRFLLFMMSLFFPSLYVAATTFHPQMLPTNLLLTFASAREPSPFPAVVEAFIMEFMFEALREAGVRLPRAIGSTVSIVGALVIGQAAVQAGIVSASIVIVVASTGIASFAIPRYNFGVAFRLLRFPILALAGTLGFYGIAVGLLALMIHLAALRSFGVPYLAPIAPFVRGNAKNVFFRPPIWSMKKRPELIVGGYSRRNPEGQGPKPPRGRR